MHLHHSGRGKKKIQETLLTVNGKSKPSCISTVWHSLAYQAEILIRWRTTSASMHMLPLWTPLEFRPPLSPSQETDYEKTQRSPNEKVP